MDREPFQQLNSGGTGDYEQTDQETLPTLARLLGFSEDVDAISVPRARLAQGLTPEVLEGTAQPGQWILPGGKTVSEVRGRIIGVRKTRALWQRDQTTSVICRSNDGVIGTGSPGGQCAECPFAQWTDHPPMCSLSYEYLIAMEGGAPIIVALSTRSAGTTIGQLNLVVRARGQVDVVLRSQLVVKGQRRYYIPVATFEWSDK